MRLSALAALFYVFFLYFTHSAYAQALWCERCGDGLQIASQDSSFYTKIRFRFQTLYSGQTEVGVQSWEEEMMIRRARLKFDGWLHSPRIVYKVELGLSNRDTRAGQISQSGNTASIILDAVVKWEFTENWYLWFGQTKLPGNRERVISSQKLQFVDRSLVNANFTLDRDLGFQLHHASEFGGMVMRQAFAVSLGEGRDVIVASPSSGRQYTARVELLPFGYFEGKGDYSMADLEREKSPKLAIGLTADYNHNAVRQNGNLGVFVTDSIGEYLNSNLFELSLDAIFKFKGVSIASEYVHRDSPNRTASFGYGSGFTASAGYLFQGNWEIAGRYTDINPISGLSGIVGATEYAIGLSKYVRGHNLKVQSDVAYTELPVGKDFYRFRLQCEVAF